MANLVSTTISGGLVHKEGTAILSGTSLTVDLSTGKTFEVDLQGASGNIATFNITNFCGFNLCIRIYFKHKTRFYC